MVPLLFRILRNLPYDMIIGRPDIVQYDLWYLLNIKNNEETIQKINIHPNIIATALESTIANIHGASLVSSAHKRTAEAVKIAQATPAANAYCKRNRKNKTQTGSKGGHGKKSVPPPQALMH